MNVNTLLLLLGSSLALCLLITPVLRFAAVRWGLVDKPDGRRKIHREPVPVVGGLAIFLAANVTLIAAFTATNTWDNLAGSSGPIYLGLFLASAVIAVVGVVDDRRGLRGRHKLFGQLAAVGIVLAFGLKVRTIHLLGWHIELGPIEGTAFTAFWLLGAINSLNLIDGMDGLLGSVGAVITLAMAVMAFQSGQWLAACVAAALAGSILGFLCFNFPPATIFLGDCGSMLIGLVIGVLAIQSSLKGPATVALAGPVALLIIPIFDTSVAIVRRKLTGRSIYTTDRGHMHHCLQRQMSNRRVLLVVGCLSVIASLGALSTMALNTEVLAPISAVTVIGILVLSRLFGHAEFLLIKARLMAVAAAVRHGDQSGRVHQLQVRLQGSADWNELWHALTACAEQLHLRTVCLDVNAPMIHESYHARWDWHPGGGSDDKSAYWRAEIPLHAHGQVVGRLEIQGARDQDSVWRKVAQVAKIVDDVELAVSNLTPAAATVPGPADDSRRPRMQPV